MQQSYFIVLITMSRDYQKKRVVKGSTPGNLSLPIAIPIVRGDCEYLDFNQSPF
jgi:hypothetical protein